MRTKTKKRALRKMKKLKKELAGDLISAEHFRQVQASYLGLLKYCRGRKIEKEIKKL